MKYKHLNGWDVPTGSRFELQLNWMKKPISSSGDEAVEFRNIVYQYNEAIERLFNSIDKYENADVIGLPLMFLVKHALEIGMKHMILSTYLREIIYGENLRGNYIEIGKKMTLKKKKVNNLKHDLKKLYEEMMVCFESLKQKTDVDLESEFMSINYHNCISGKKDGDNNVNRKCMELFGSKLNTPLPYFEILNELCELIKSLDEYDSAFKYDLTQQNQPALNVHGDQCINLALVVCHYWQIAYPLYGIEDALFEIFEYRKELYGEKNGM